MPRPRFVIMSGPPGAGKTTSAPALAHALDMPVFTIDVDKERLADAIGKRALEFADALGVAALQQVVDIARELLAAGDDVMIEGFMRHGQAEPLLIPLTAMADTVVVHLYADDLVLMHRYEARAMLPERHWIHGDIARIGTLLPELPADMAAPLDLGTSRIFVDTTAGTMPVGNVATLVTAAVGSSPPRDHTLPSLQPS